MPASSKNQRRTPDEGSRHSEAITSSEMDDEVLAAQIAAIVGRSSSAADEFSLLLLSVLEDIESGPRALVAATPHRAVELAFGHTDTWHAALELYTLDKRGILTCSAGERLINLFAS